LKAYRKVFTQYSGAQGVLKHLMVKVGGKIRVMKREFNQFYFSCENFHFYVKGLDVIPLKLKKNLCMIVWLHVCVSN